MPPIKALRLNATQAAQRQEWGVARTQFQKALAADPDWVDGWLNLGVCCLQLGLGVDALEALRQGLERAPALPRVRLALADACALLGDSAEAAHWCEEESVRFPRQSEGWLALGIAYERLGLASAHGAYEKAFALSPSNPATAWNWGRRLQEDGHLAEAERVLRQGWERHPEFGGLAWEFTVNCFLRGDVDAGLRLLDTRRLAPGFPVRSQVGHLPLWSQGTPPKSPVFLEPEQGLGDTLQFVRFAPHLAALGVEVWLGVPKSLESLLTEFPGVHRLLTDPKMSEGAACRLPLLSLPTRLGIRAADLDGRPYLQLPRPALRRKPAPGKRLRVGLVWRGNPQHKNDSNRSIPILELLPLLSLPDIEWVSLQLGTEAARDLERLEGTGISISDATTAIGSYRDTADRLLETDMVVSVDTSVAHLAGALGHPVCLLLPFYPDWRWGFSGNETPWYRSMHVFRQETKGGWQVPIGFIKRFLAQFQSLD